MFQHYFSPGKCCCQYLLMLDIMLSVSAREMSYSIDFKESVSLCSLFFLYSMFLEPLMLYIFIFSPKISLFHWKWTRAMISSILFFLQANDLTPHLHSCFWSAWLSIELFNKHLKTWENDGVHAAAQLQVKLRVPQVSVLDLS